MKDTLLIEQQIIILKSIMAIVLNKNFFWGHTL